MTTKLEQAARQIIVDWDSGIHLHETITALREVLAEQAEQEQNSMFIEGYRIGLAEMREKCATVVTEHAPTCSPHWVSYVAAIRAIKFEGDTGFRPVSEMVSDHFAASGKPMKQQAVPDHAVCRSFGCGKKATTVIKDSKGRRQYCCPKHDGSQRIKERKK